MREFSWGRWLNRRGQRAHRPHVVTTAGLPDAGRTPPPGVRPGKKRLGPGPAAEVRPVSPRGCFSAGNYGHQHPARPIAESDSSGCNANTSANCRARHQSADVSGRDRWGTRSAEAASVVPPDLVRPGAGAPANAIVKYTARPAGVR